MFAAKNFEEDVRVFGRGTRKIDELGNTLFSQLCEELKTSVLECFIIALIHKIEKIQLRESIK